MTARLFCREGEIRYIPILLVCDVLAAGSGLGGLPSGRWLQLPVRIELLGVCHVRRCGRGDGGRELRDVGYAEVAE